MVQIYRKSDEWLFIVDIDSINLTNAKVNLFKPLTDAGTTMYHFFVVNPVKNRWTEKNFNCQKVNTSRDHFFTHRKKRKPLIENAPFKNAAAGSIVFM